MSLRDNSVLLFVSFVKDRIKYLYKILHDNYRLYLYNYKDRIKYKLGNRRNEIA